MKCVGHSVKHGKISLGYMEECTTLYHLDLLLPSYIVQCPSELLANTMARKMWQKKVPK